MRNNNYRRAKANLFVYPRNSIFYRIYLWISGRHWWIIGLTAILLMVVEAFDFIRHNGDYIHVIEFSIYVGLLFVVGLLIDL